MYQQDRKVAATARQSHARVQPLQFATPRSKSFHDGAQTLLVESAEALESTSLIEEKEDTEARRAGVKARAADAELGEAFEDCHCSVYAHQLALRARSREEGLALGEEIDVTLEGTTPSSFRTLSSSARSRPIATHSFGHRQKRDGSVGLLRRCIASPASTSLPSL